MISLQSIYSVILHPTSPFNFDASLYKPDHFPTPDHYWQPGTRWQTMRWAGKPLGLKFEQRGTTEKPEVSLHIFASQQLTVADLESLNLEIRYRYCFDVDLTAFYDRFRKDEHLGPVLTRWQGMRDLNCNSLYEYLIIAIVLQNATVRRSVTMMQNLFEKYGDLVEYDGKELYCFWIPEKIMEINEAELRTLKVGYRAKTILRVTDYFVNNHINEETLRHKPYPDQRQTLLNLYGIGPASVGYILSAVFHHLDELQHISPWEQKIYSKLFFNRNPDDPMPANEMIKFFTDHYSGYRALVIHYFWEDLFWQWKAGKADWLNAFIRL